MVFNDLFHQFAQVSCGFSRNLQQQALLQITGSDACRIESLKTLQHRFYLAFWHIYIMVYGQFVGNISQILSQKTVIIQRAYEVLHDIALRIGKLNLAHLLFQFVVKRGCVAPYRFLIIRIRVARRSQMALRRRQFVVAPKAFKSAVKGFFAFLALRFLLVKLLFTVSVIVGRGAAFRHIGVVMTFFEGGIIVKFGIDILLKLGQRHL